MNPFTRLRRMLLGRSEEPPTQGALKIVLQYAVFATLWILFSDEAVGLLIKDPRLMVTVNMLKGALFVAITALLLLVLVMRFGARLSAQQAEKAGVEADLRSNEALFKALAEGASEAFFVHDVTGRFLAANQKAWQSLGYTQAELLTLGLADIDPVFSLQEVEDRWSKAQPGYFVTFTTRHQRKDGSLLPVEIRATVFEFGSQNLFLAVARDLTEALQTAQALQESEARFTTAFQFVPVGLAITRLQDGIFLTVNEAFLQIFGHPREHLENRSALELGMWADPLARKQVADDLTMGRPVMNREIQCRTRGGALLDVVYSGKIVNMQGVPCLLSATVDVTAKRQAEAEHARLEAEIQHAQKLESLGGLASGVAHDMNNVLAAIQSVGEVLKSRLASDPEALGSLETIAKATTRGRNLVRSLTNFARKDLREAECVDLNQVVRDEADLLDRTLLQKVKLALQLEENLPAILGEPGPLGNALMNLCVNAVDAMASGGTLSIRTRSLEGGWLELAVEDSGEGMAPLVKARATEPFFTTKPQGKGTGLGLAMVHGIVKAHGGTLEIQSELGCGTTIRLQFPALPLGRLAEPAPAIPAPARGLALRILLVDDDDLIRASVPAMLSVSGHTTVSAESIKEGLALLAEGLEVDLAILDLNMPDMGGAEGLAPIRVLRPRLPVLIATGYLDEETQAFLGEQTRVATLAKPFSLKELEARLEELGEGL